MIISRKTLTGKGMGSSSIRECRDPRHLQSIFPEIMILRRYFMNFHNCLSEEYSNGP